MENHFLENKDTNFWGAQKGGPLYPFVCGFAEPLLASPFVDVVNHDPVLCVAYVRDTEELEFLEFFNLFALCFVALEDDFREWHTLFVIDSLVVTPTMVP